MSLSHGVYIQEMQTPTTALTQIDSGVIVAVGTAPIQQKSVVLCNNLTEFVQNFGGGEGYTLNEVANCAFGLYNISPVIFINVFDPDKHFKEVENEFEGQTQFRIENSNLITDSIKITSGEKIEPTVLIKNTDYVADMMNLHEGEDAVAAIEILNLNKIVDGKFKVSYRRTRDALGGEPVIEEVSVSELEDNIWELTDDAILESVTVETGEVNTLVDIPFEVAQDSTGATIITILLGAPIVDDTVKLYYKLKDPTKVTAAEIIGGVNPENGEKYGLELIDAVPAKLGLNSTFTIIAPGFSEIPEVAAALAGKAKGLIFPSIAIADIDSEECKTYQAAVEWKTQHGLANPFLIYTYPRVILGDTQYYLSTHLACVMNLTDADNNFLPYVSPSNQRLQISGACLADGTEVFYSQDQANALGEVGIVTAFNRNSWRVWNNMNSAYPGSQDVKDIYISTRRMLNYLETYLQINYFSNLDAPITRRAVDSILQSANLYLASLVSQQALIDGELTFDESENPVSNLLAGRICFNLRYASPTPAQSIVFKIQFDASYYEDLFS